jgi:hypothetical protein
MRSIPALPLAAALLLPFAADSAARPEPPPRSTAPLPELVEQAARFAGSDHDARLAALRTLLVQQGLDHRLVEFANPHPERDPRPLGHNVEVLLGPPDAAREIVVGAHYDAARLADGSHSDGMVDNAAGSVVLAHVARALADRPLRHRLRVVFFDLEEAGLLGSAHYAAALDRDRVAAMVNLDVQGYGDTVLFGPAAQPGNAAVYAAMRTVCSAADFDCLQFPRYPPSDDRSFQAAGIANISLAVMPAVEAHQMWLLLNGGADSGLREGFLPAVLGTIHSADDTAERLDPVAMTLGHDAVLALVLELDRRLE